MITSVSALLNAVQTGKAQFEDVLNYINQHYYYTPTAFNNGKLYNAENENAGSCRVFAFAKLHNLSAPDTLSLFAEHYKSVIANPIGSDHQNIRQFKKYSWAGISLKGEVLKAKPPAAKPVDQKAI